MSHSDLYSHDLRFAFSVAYFCFVRILLGRSGTRLVFSLFLLWKVSWKMVSDVVQIISRNLVRNLARSCLFATILEVFAHPSCLGFGFGRGQKRNSRRSLQNVTNKLQIVFADVQSHLALIPGHVLPTKRLDPTNCVFGQ